MIPKSVTNASKTNCRIKYYSKTVIYLLVRWSFEPRFYKNLSQHEFRIYTMVAATLRNEQYVNIFFS